MKTEEILKKFEAVGLNITPNFEEPVALLVIMDETAIANISPISKDKLQDYVELAKFVVDTYIDSDSGENDPFETIFTTSSGVEFELSEVIPMDLGNFEVESVSIIVGSQEYLLAKRHNF